MPFNQVIIFVNQVEKVDKLGDVLRMQLFNPLCIHSRLPQVDRLRSYDVFKNNGSRILIATDIFGRGIDIEKVNLVINFGISLFIQISLPNQRHTCTEQLEQVVLEKKE